MWRLSTLISRDDFQRLSRAQVAGIRAIRQRHQNSKVERREDGRGQR